MLKYKGLKVTAERVAVADAEVDRQIEKLLEQNLKTIEITDRPSQLDDELVLDYAGTVDGVAFEGGTAENQTLVLGSGQFIPGFEAQLVDKNIGDVVDVRVTFPTEYPAENLAGQDAVFRCKIRGIRLREKYLPDDQFAMEVGGFDSFDAMKTAIRERLQSYIDRQADDELKGNLLDQVCEGQTFNGTQEQLDKAVDMEMRQLEAQLGRQRLTLDLYCQFMNKTREQLREECVPNARRNALRQQVVMEIADAEHIEADEDSVADAIQKICRENNLTIDELQSYVTVEFQAALVRSVITDKVLNFLKDNAEITYTEKNA